MKATLKGVKQEELAGFDEAFGGRPSVTRDEMAQHFNDRMPQIETKVLAGEGPDGARFSGEVLPGGTNYREMLLKLPNQDEATKPFQSSHWKDPNVLAHLRMSDRVGLNGEKVLHVEEIQSDWGQKGRQEGFVDPVAHRKHKEAKDKMNDAYKSFNDLVNNLPLPESVLALNAPFRPGEETPRQYERRQEDFQEARLEFLRHTPEWQASRKQYSDARDEFHNLGEPPSSKGVPTGPYVTNTQAWTDLALKAALKEAAHGNYDRVAWTNGQDQAERYDLSKHLDSVHYNPGTQNLYAFDKRGRQVLEEDAEPHEIEKHIGKDLAQKLLADTPDFHSTMNEHDIERDPESGKWNIYLHGEPVHEYGGEMLEFDSKGHARDHLREMVEDSLQNHTSILKNVDLVVGGEGMKSYYDKIVPSRIMDVAKKAGAPVKVEPHKIDTAEGEKTLHSIRMTPDLRAAIMRGLPVYKDGGSVGDRDAKGEGGEEDGAMKAPPVFTRDLVNRALAITRVGNPMQPATPGASTTKSNLSGLVHRPIEEMSATYVPVGEMIPERSVSWEKLQGGHLIPAVGDRTMGGHALTHINDKELSFYPSLEGGYDFMRSKAAQDDKAAWASGQGVITSLGKLVRQTAEKGDPVYFAHSSMSGESGDFSHMMTDALLAQIAGSKISKKAKDAFDEDMQKAVGSKWPGIRHREIREHLYSHGPSRYWFGKTVDKKEHQKEGFPNAASTRYAITANDLINTPSGDIGRSIAQLDPGGEGIKNPQNPHSTYPVQLKGTGYVGRPEAPLPREVAFPKWTAARREANIPARGDERSFNLGRFSEPLDQQWIDGVMKFLEEKKRRG